jgi:hypothetical protein
VSAISDSFRQFSPIYACQLRILIYPATNRSPGIRLRKHKDAKTEVSVWNVR